MPVTKNATSVFSNSLTGNVVSASVARAVGEGLLIYVWQECDFAAVGSAGAPVWDVAGDNQSATSQASQIEWISAGRKLSLFVLPAPTTAKTATIESTLTGGYGGANTHERASMLVVRISGHDASDMIRASNATQIAAPETNDLPNTVTSAVGDLVVYVGSGREFISEFAAGDTSGYEEFTTAISSRSLFVGTKAGAASATTGTFAYISSTGQSNALIAVSIKAGAEPAPTITGNPSGASVTAPSTGNFTASVTGTYTGLRWQRQAAGAGGWADVSGGTGGTTTSYTTGATAVSGGSFNSTDRFRLAVDWSGGVVYSTDVALTVSAGGTAPSITVQPVAPTVTAGSTAGMSVTATGSALTYQWQRQPAAGGGYVNVSGGSGGTTATYTTPATTISGGSANNGDTYQCVVTGDTAPPATSNAVALTVQQPIATTFTFSFNGGNSLTGLKYAVFDQVTPDLWVAPIKKASNGSSNGSGLVTIDVTGLTAKRIGELGSAFVTNSDGTATGGAQAATRKAAYYVGVFA